MALVSLIDGERLFFKSVAGTDCRQGALSDCGGQHSTAQHEAAGPLLRLRVTARYVCMATWLPSSRGLSSLHPCPPPLQATACTRFVTPACGHPTQP